MAQPRSRCTPAQVRGPPQCGAASDVLNGPILVRFEGGKNGTDGLLSK
jgi:hypothetical protein